MEIKNDGRSDFSDFQNAVYHAILERHRGKPLAASTSPPPEYLLQREPVIERPFRKIYVSRWLMDELRVQHGKNSAVHGIMVDWCDGNGPRLKWLGLECDFDRKLDGMHCRLE